MPSRLPKMLIGDLVNTDLHDWNQIKLIAINVASQEIALVKKT